MTVRLLILAAAVAVAAAVVVDWARHTGAQLRSHYPSAEGRP